MTGVQTCALPISQAQVYYERYLALTPGGDATVGKWITDLKNRKGKAPAADAPKEQS